METRFCQKKQEPQLTHSINVTMLFVDLQPLNRNQTGIRSLTFYAKTEESGSQISEIGVESESKI